MMKKKLIIILIMSLLITIAILPVVESVNYNKKVKSEDSIIIVLGIKSYKISKDDNGIYLPNIEDFTSTSSPGDPILPHKIFNILVHPDIDWSTINIDIITSKITTFTGIIDIKPAEPICTWDEEQVITIFEEGKDIVNGKNMRVYGNDVFFPEKCINLIAKQQMRKWKFVQVDFFPFQYNPISHELLLTENITIKISYNRSNEGLPVKFVEDNVMDDVASQIFFNYDEGKNWYCVDDSYKSLSQYDKGYAIITTNAIESGSNKLDDFVTYKQNLGHDVYVITEDEYSGLTGQPPDGTAEKIRKWLINNYLSKEIEYVLLIGNPNPEDPVWDNIIGDIPMKTCYPNPIDGVEGGYPTDYFYADLTGNWDADGDLIFGEWWEYGEYDDVDLFPEVYVGRIPVYSTNYNDLDKILQKIIDYDTESSDVSWRKNVLLSMGFQNDWYDGAALSEQMIDDYLNPNGYLDWTMYQQGSVNPAYDSLWNSDEELRGNENDPAEPTSQECLKDRWSGVASPSTPNDFGIVCWWAHGHDTHAYVYYDGTLFCSNDCSSLDDDHPSWIFQCSCGNGHPESINNLGYSLIKNGGIGTVSSSRNSYFWTGDTYGDFDNSRGTEAGLCYEYIMRLSAQELQAGKALFLAKYSLTPWIHTLYSFNLYGDPGLNIIPSLHPPDKPNTPSGETSGKTGKTYPYTTSTIDSDNDMVKYGWDWNGDNTVDEWTGFYPSGTTISTSHSWEIDGTFNVKVIAEDTDGLQSEWSDPLVVSMPRSRAINTYLLRFLQQHPILYQLIQRFFKL